MQVEIQVSDVNNNPPAFSQTSCSVNVPENSLENLLLLIVHASNPDKGMNRKVSYSLHSADEGDDDEENSLFDITGTAWETATRGGTRLVHCSSILAQVRKGTHESGNVQPAACECCCAPPVLLKSADCRTC